jgi:site-specific DNA-cytosine methylase
MLENVAGFLTSHEGHDFQDACLALNDLGYAVDAFMIDAALFVPQSRMRMFLIGKREKRKPMRVEEAPSFYESQCRPHALADFIFCHPDIRWALQDLPHIPKRETGLADILEDLPANSAYWWSKDRAEYLLNQMSERHRAVAEEMIAGNKTTYGTVFRRVRHGRSMAELRTDTIAGCLRTPRGGSGRQILFAAGKRRYKVLRESALGAVLNEKEMAPQSEITLPISHKQRIIPDSIYRHRKHPDIRIARRATTIANLARVISERDVSDGLRRTLLTQARRLERLAAQRVQELRITGDFKKRT